LQIGYAGGEHAHRVSPAHVVFDVDAVAAVGVGEGVKGAAQAGDVAGPAAFGNAQLGFGFNQFLGHVAALLLQAVDAVAVAGPHQVLARLLERFL
jgi:hypothetical protein